MSWARIIAFQLKKSTEKKSREWQRRQQRANERNEVPLVDKRRQSRRSLFSLSLVARLIRTDLRRSVSRKFENEANETEDKSTSEQKKYNNSINLKKKNHFVGQNEGFILIDWMSHFRSKTNSKSLTIRR